MKYIIIGVLASIIGGNIVANSWQYNEMNPIVYAKEPEAPREIRIEPVVEWTKERIKQEVETKAKEYGVSFEELWSTIKCENPSLDPSLQSQIVKHGVREDSWGLAQFWLPAKNKTRDGRVITKEIATNPEEAIDAMAWHFSQGSESLWSCYRQLYE